MGRYYPRDQAFVWVPAKAVVPTDSAQNWGSILHGVLPERHGLRNGDVETGAPFDENSPYPSIFKILSESGLNVKLASYVSWSPINSAIIEQSVKGDFYSPLTDENIFVRWWLKFQHYIGNSCYDAVLLEKLVKYIRNFDTRHKNEKLLLFVHLTDVDEYGHVYGFGSEKYGEQIKVMESYVRRIITAIDEEWKNNTHVIITTDHGGIENRHGGESEEEVNVFIALRGRGIEPDVTINGDARNMDVAAWILAAFGCHIPPNFDATLSPFLKNFQNLTRDTNS